VWNVLTPASRSAASQDGWPACTPRNAEASADVQYSLRLTRGDHLNHPESPSAEPPWWRRPRRTDEDYLQELLYGATEDGFWDGAADDNQPLTLDPRIH
jgi:hypothetical protein